MTSIESHRLQKLIIFLNLGRSMDYELRTVLHRVSARCWGSEAI